MSKILPVLSSVIIALLLFSCAQRRVKQSPDFKIETDFANQGEQEIHWAKRLLNERYERKNYKKYKGKVVVAGHTFNFGKRVILQLDQSEYLRELLESGLIYPSLFNEIPGLHSSSKSRLAKEKERPVQHEALTTTSLFDRPYSDTLRISGLTELKSAEASVRSRRFQFWLFNPGFANPTVYLIELTNNRVTAHEDVRTFIKGAHLTFAIRGWLVI